jgi:hypothetical protein
MKPKQEQMAPYMGDTRELSNEHAEAQEGLDYPWRTIETPSQNKAEWMKEADRKIAGNDVEYGTRASLEENESIKDLEAKAAKGSYTPMSGAARARHQAGMPAKFGKVDD